MKDSQEKIMEYMEINMRVYAEYDKNLVSLYSPSSTPFEQLPNLSKKLKSEVEAKGVTSVFNSFNAVDTEDLDLLLNKAIEDYREHNGSDLEEVLSDGTMLTLKRVNLFEDEDDYCWGIQKNEKAIESFIEGARNLAEEEFYRIYKDKENDKK